MKTTVYTVQALSYALERSHAVTRDDTARAMMQCADIDDRAQWADIAKLAGVKLSRAMRGECEAAREYVAAEFAEHMARVMRRDNPRDDMTARLHAAFDAATARAH